MPALTTAVLPPVTVTLCENTSHVAIRFSDQGGGISPKNMDHIWEYSFTTANEEDDDDMAGGLFGTWQRDHSLLN